MATSQSETLRCVGCGGEYLARDPDPWEGRMDDYCTACAWMRHDAYPAAHFIDHQGRTK